MTSTKLERAAGAARSYLSRAGVEMTDQAIAYEGGTVVTGIDDQGLVTWCFVRFADIEESIEEIHFVYADFLPEINRIVGEELAPEPDRVDFILVKAIASDRALLRHSRDVNISE